MSCHAWLTCTASAAYLGSRAFRSCLAPLDTSIFMASRTAETASLPMKASQNQPASSDSGDSNHLIIAARVHIQMTTETNNQFTRTLSRHRTSGQYELRALHAGTISNMIKTTVRLIFGVAALILIASSPSLAHDWCYYHPKQAQCWRHHHHWNHHDSRNHGSELRRQNMSHADNHPENSNHAENKHRG